VADSRVLASKDAHQELGCIRLHYKRDRSFHKVRLSNLHLSRLESFLSLCKQDTVRSAYLLDGEEPI
jgi:hypothetical protein